MDIIKKKTLLLYLTDYYYKNFGYLINIINTDLLIFYFDNMNKNNTKLIIRKESKYNIINMKNIKNILWKNILLSCLNNNNILVFNNIIDNIKLDKHIFIRSNIIYLCVKYKYTKSSIKILNKYFDKYDIMVYYNKLFVLIYQNDSKLFKYLFLKHRPTLDELDSLFICDYYDYLIYSCYNNKNIKFIIEHIPLSNNFFNKSYFPSIFLYNFNIFKKILLNNILVNKFLLATKINIYSKLTQLLMTYICNLFDIVRYIDASNIDKFYYKIKFIIKFIHTNKPNNLLDNIYVETYIVYIYNEIKKLNEHCICYELLLLIEKYKLFYLFDKNKLINGFAYKLVIKHVQCIMIKGNYKNIFKCIYS